MLKSAVSIAPFAALLPIALAVIVLLVLYLRGGRYVFLDRLWRLLHAKDFYDPALQRHHEQQLDIERFRVMYGARAIETLEAAYAALEWSREVQISLVKLAKAGRWVKWDERLIAKPRTLHTVANCVAALALYVMVFASAGLALTNEMLGRFVDSGTWIWLETDQARSANPWTENEWTLTRDNCDNDITNVIRKVLTLEEVQTLCNSFGTAELADDISDNVHIQRWTMGIATGVLVWLFYLVLLSLKRRIEAIDMRRRLKKTQGAHSTRGREADPAPPALP